MQTTRTHAELSKEFFEFLTVEKEASKNTLSCYRNNIRQFMAYCEDQSVINVLSIAPTTITAYLDYLVTQKYAEATIARKFAAVKSFLAFLTAQRYMKDDPTAALSSPRVSKLLPRPITPEQVKKLLELPLHRDTPEAKRDKAMLEVLYATGMRVGELVLLNLESITTTADGASIRCSGRTIPVHDQAIESLAIYLNRRSALVRDRHERALFLNRYGERLTRQGFWLILKAYVDASNINVHITPHTLRHSFASHMLKGGAPLRTVQQLLGHAHITSTRIYDPMAKDGAHAASVRSAYNKAHPRAMGYAVPAAV